MDRDEVEAMATGQRLARMMARYDVPLSPLRSRVLFERLLARQREESERRQVRGRWLARMVSGAVGALAAGASAVKLLGR